MRQNVRHIGKIRNVAYCDIWQIAPPAIDPEDAIPGGGCCHIAQAVIAAVISVFTDVESKGRAIG